MAAPTRVFAKAWEVSFTVEQEAALRTEALLTNRSVSAVVRAAVDAYLTPNRKGR